MRKFIAEDSFWNIFPDVEIGVISADNILPTCDISPEKQQQAQEYLQQANKRAQKWIENPTISKNPVVSI